MAPQHKETHTRHDHTMGEKRAAVGEPACTKELFSRGGIMAAPPGSLLAGAEVDRPHAAAEQPAAQGQPQQQRVLLVSFHLAGRHKRHRHLDRGCCLSMGGWGSVCVCWGGGGSLPSVVSPTSGFKRPFSVRSKEKRSEGG